MTRSFAAAVGSLVLLAVAVSTDPVTSFIAWVWLAVRLGRWAEAQNA